MSVNIKYKNNSIATLTDTGTKTLKTSGKYCEADIIVENTKDGGGSVEPFTKIITGTITYAENTTAFQLPETENFLAAYFIRTDFWGVNNEIHDNGAQLALFASGQRFGYFSPVPMSSVSYQSKDSISVYSDALNLSDGKITIVNARTSFYGTYYYALIYGTK